MKKDDRQFRGVVLVTSSAALSFLSLSAEAVKLEIGLQPGVVTRLLLIEVLARADARGLEDIYVMLHILLIEFVQPGLNRATRHRLDG